MSRDDKPGDAPGRDGADRPARQRSYRQAFAASAARIWAKGAIGRLTQLLLAVRAEAAITPLQERFEASR